MKWKFWQKEKDNKNETTIEVKNIVATSTTGLDSTIFVKAQSPEKALELYDKLKERNKACQS